MMKIGTHVWHRNQYSGTINESIITNIERIVRTGREVYRLATLQGVTVLGTCGADMETLYPSMEEAIEREHMKARRCIDAYKQELRGASEIETMKNLIAFAYDTVVSSAEEYTNENARTAYQELANEMGVELA